jgi:tetratricopeptide (TPR) repeat protein
MFNSCLASACLLLAVLPIVACARSSGSEAPSSASSSPGTTQLDACAVALASSAAQQTSTDAIGRAMAEARGPNSRSALERLGYLYVARARISNDPGDYTLANKAAECLELRFPDDSAALLLRGHVLHQLHRFREAEGVARTLIARRTLPLDYGLLGDALMEQGRVDDAASAYQKMLDLRPYYQSYTRAAHMRWLRGDLDGAIQAIRLAIGAASPRDPEAAAWAWTRLAAYELQAGTLGDAERSAASALEHQPDYAAALLTKGRVLLARKNATDAVVALRRAAELNPLPEYQWALADALRLLELDTDAAAVERAIVASAHADPRTVALFLATRRVETDRALTLTEDELQVRADVFTLDARAWALAAAGRASEARSVMERALAEQTKDARLFLHAGVIHAAAGDRRSARQWLTKATRIRGMLLPSEANLLDTHLGNAH